MDGRRSYLMTMANKAGWVHPAREVYACGFRTPKLGNLGRETACDGGTCHYPNLQPARFTARLQADRQLRKNEYARKIQSFECKDMDTCFYRKIRTCCLEPRNLC